MMHLSILSEELEPSYEAFLSQHPAALFYYSVKYKNFLKTLLNCQEMYLLAIEGGEIQGILPLLYLETDAGRLFNSLPYYGSHGGPLANSLSAEVFLLDAYNQVATATNTISATLITNPLCKCFDTQKLAYNFTDQRVSQITAIHSESAREGSDQLLRRFESSAQRNIKKAQQAGINIEINGDYFEDLKHLHQLHMQEIGGTAKNEFFFSLIPDYFVAGKDYDLFIAKKNNEVISALLVFYYHQTVEYFTPVTKSDAKHLQPLPLIIWTAMQKAANQGYRYWNWGGTWLNQDGVYRFKKKWAATEKNYFYYTQLNHQSLLNLSQQELLTLYPNFYVVPFSELINKTRHVQGTQGFTYIR